MTKLALLFAALTLAFAPAAYPAADLIVPASAWETPDGDDTNGGEEAGGEETEEDAYDPDYDPIVGIESEHLDLNTGIIWTKFKLGSGGITPPIPMTEWAEGPPAPVDSVTGEPVWDDTTAICQDYGGCE